LRLAILETGQPPAEVIERFGDYPSMFRTLFGREAYAYQTFDVAAGQYPEQIADFPAYVITGSSAGVYDPLPWIAPLMDFLRQAKGQAAMVGVCFGHQVMAEAFGGKVIKSPKGWGVGLHSYDVREGRPWMDAAPRIAVPASHQDQVVDLPPGARVVASSDFTPFGMLAYDEAKAVSIQLHPEFQPDYAKALIETRRGTRYTDEQADAAIATYDAPDDRARLGAWIQDFLTRTAG